MEAVDLIREIETKYDVAEITVNGIQVWPVLRIHYFWQFRFANAVRQPTNNSEAEVKHPKLYGFMNFFNRYKFFIFTDQMEIRDFNGHEGNKLTDAIVKKLGHHNVITFLRPVDWAFFHHKKMFQDHIISSKYLYFLRRFFPRKKFSISNEYILTKISHDYKINVPYRDLLAEFFAFCALFNFLFFINAPKAIFVSEYYNTLHQAAIYSAKKRGIVAIELQHGVINRFSANYNVFTELDRSTFPDKLFTFGEHAGEIFNNDNFFIESPNVFPIGNMYVQYILENVPNHVKEYFNDLRKNYKIIVVVSSQWIIESRLINFIAKAASNSPDIAYIFVPRRKQNDVSRMKLPDNVIINMDIDVYNIISHSNFHATIFSTTALEAPALGVPNIMIDLDNLSNKNYGTILTNQDTTKYVKTVTEFVNCINTWKPLRKNEIMRTHSKIIATKYHENLDASLKTLGLLP